MRNLVPEAVQTSEGKKAEQTRTANKKGYFSELVRGRMCKHLFFVLLFGCQLLVNCEAKMLTKVVQKPGYYSHQTVFYNGPNVSSVINNLKSAGFSTPSSEHRQPSSGVGSSLRKVKSQRPISPMSGRQSFGSVSPPKYRRQDSGSSLGSFPDMAEWRKQTQKTFADLRKNLLRDMSDLRKGLRGGLIRKPTQVIGYGSDGSFGSSPKFGGTSASRKKNTGRWTGQSTDSDDSDGYSSPNDAGSDNFHQECLAAHNDYRKIHGVPPLRLNNRLSQISQRWAQHLASTLDSVYGIYHSDKKFRKGYGENIYASSGFKVNGRTGVDDWYSEIDDYDFRTGESTNGKMIGHLTQLLWKTSKELGVGYAFNSNGAIFVVCHYNPAGNYEGLNTKYVPPVGGFSEEDLQKQAEEDTRRRQMMFGPLQSFLKRL